MQQRALVPIQQLRKRATAIYLGILELNSGSRMRSKSYLIDTNMKLDECVLCMNTEESQLLSGKGAEDKRYGPAVEQLFSTYWGFQNSATRSAWPLLIKSSA